MKKNKRITKQNTKNKNLILQVFLKPNSSANDINEFIKRIEEKAQIIQFNVRSFVFYVKTNPDYIKKCDRDLNVLSSWCYITPNAENELSK